MKKARKKQVFVPEAEIVRVIDDYGWSVKKAASELSISESRVYRALRRIRQSPEGVIAEPTPKFPSVLMTMLLGLTDRPTEIKLRNSTGENLGTIWLSDEGVRYKRPNQKGDCPRVISYALMDKLMQLGLT
jgi:hypothetical protein